MLNAPRNDTTLRIATLLAYFPGLNRDEIVKFLGSRIDAIVEPMQYLIEHGYIERSRVRFGGFDAVLAEWSPAEDQRAHKIECRDREHPTVDEEPPVRFIT